MGLFDIFKKQQSAGDAESSVIQAQPASDEIEITEEQIEEIRRQIEKKIIQTAYCLSVNMERKPELTDTKFGGVPYWPSDKLYPLDGEGGPLMLLAQINMKDFAGDERLLDKGLLQFYIAADDVYGMDFDEQDSQKNFRVVYHEDMDDTVTLEGILELGIRVSSDVGDAGVANFFINHEDLKQKDFSKILYNWDCG